MPVKYTRPCVHYWTHGQEHTATPTNADPLSTPATDRTMAAARLSLVRQIEARLSAYLHQTSTEASGPPDDQATVRRRITDAIRCAKDGKQNEERIYEAAKVARRLTYRRKEREKKQLAATTAALGSSHAGAVESPFEYGKSSQHPDQPPALRNRGNFN
jgi:hypothetical protein